MTTFSLREKKPGILKVALLEEMLRLLGDHNLNDIALETLCKNVQTTKVTFFKYFSHKEQLLDYYIQKWLYDRSYEWHNQIYQGAQGIYHMFYSIGEAGSLSIKIMLALVQYYCKLTQEPERIEISDYEYLLFNKDAYEQKVIPYSLCELFTHYLSQERTIDPTQYQGICDQLLALMYGVPIQAHIMQERNVIPQYEQGLHNIFGGMSKINQVDS